MHTIVNNTPFLKILHLIKCKQINNFACIALLKFLKELEIRYSAKLLDNNIEKISSQGTLKRLRLELCPKITNKSILLVAKKCTQLSEVYLKKKK